MRAPFEGFLLNKDTGRPTLQLGMTINISLSLETSGEDSTPRDWSSDTAATIQYTLSDSTAQIFNYNLLLFFYLFFFLI
ncbi:unnamed protein product [Adineta steineri]|nr:unnamed protein product [Adineta steineri]